jgi:RNA polymerase sigma-70 factor, ECF subfamily
MAFNSDMNFDINIEFGSLKEHLLSYLYRLTANKEDAEDILHDTYIKVIEKSATLREESAFKTWVFSIATNLAKDNQRVKNRWALDVQDQCKNAAVNNKHIASRIETAFNNQTEKRFEIKEHINYCFTCIAKNLTLEKQIAIILKELYEFKRSEIARILDLSEGSVKHLLFNGRKELQDKYNNRCAIINKKGVCYQCAELNDHLQVEKDAHKKIAQLGFNEGFSPEQNLEIRFHIINKINPLISFGSDIEDTILQILRETISDR